MIHAGTHTLLCGHCATATSRSERGWRAYRSVDLFIQPAIVVLCPSCSERLHGEDEADNPTFR